MALISSPLHSQNDPISLDLAQEYGMNTTSIDWLSVSVYFEELSTQVMSIKQKIELFELLSNIGGQIGAFAQSFPQFLKHFRSVDGRFTIDSRSIALLRLHRFVREAQ